VVVAGLADRAAMIALTSGNKAVASFTRTGIRLMRVPRIDARTVDEPPIRGIICEIIATTEAARAANIGNIL
jgi:hypothetical protein